MRTEKDALGEMQLPDDAYYGIQAIRAAANFDVTSLTFNDFPSIVRAMVEVKKACAMTNRAIGALDKDKADAITRACDDILSGKIQGQFPVNIWRGGGTSINMNVNEVVATRANEILTGKKGCDAVHPNTHVNMCQSSNDVYPTAEHIVLYREIGDVLASVEILENALADKAREFKDIVRLGRTALQDGVPMTMGQVFAGFRGLVRRNRKLLEVWRDEYRTVVIGGTVSGTGLGIMPGYFERIHADLLAVTGIDLHAPGPHDAEEIILDEGLLDAMQNSDSFLILAAYMRAIACAGGKLANDLRLLSSGPRAGFGEIVLPALTPGSSIMPGKVNPFLCDLMVQVMHQVAGNDWAGAMNTATSDLDLGPNMTVALFGALQSMEMIKNAFRLFSEHCIRGIRVNEATCREYAEKSTSLAIMVGALYGYDVGARIAKVAITENISCKEAASRENLISGDAAEELFDVAILADRRKSVALFAKYSTLRQIK